MTVQLVSTNDQSLLLNAVINVALVVKKTKSMYDLLYGVELMQAKLNWLDRFIIIAVHLIILPSE